jgi:dolichyl-phosphate-mannose-protein mannosyltransferase
MLTAPRPIADPVRRNGVALAVALILLASAALRLWQLGVPADMMFDEIYYAKDAKAIVDNRVGTHGQYRWAAGDEVSWPHPEMGKYAIALGILLFGDRSFGWRIPAAVAGVALLACVYPLGRRLGLSPPWALLALLFAAADPLGIAQSRIATLDIFIALWTVVCLLFILRYVQDGWRARWLFLGGLAGGMAASTKWSGGLALVAALLIIIVSWLLQRRAARRAAATEDAGDAETGEVQAVAAPGPTLDAGGMVRSRSGVPLTPPLAEQMPASAPQGSAWARTALLVAALALVPAAVYMLGYVQYFLAGHTWADFVELHRQALYFNLHLHATHTYASRAYTWIFDYRPVWYYFQGKKTYHGVISIGNPFLWWLAAFSLAAAVVVAVLRKSYALLPAAAIVALLYLPWFATSRTSFMYYMTPVAPVMAVLVAGALSLFAAGVVPRRGWIAGAGAALATAALWDLIAVQVLRIGNRLGWVDKIANHPLTGGSYVAGVVAVGLIIAAIVGAILLSRRLKPYRPWMAMVIAGLVIGIVVAFIPVVLGIGISPTHWQHIMWFRSWI